VAKGMAGGQEVVGGGQGGGAHGCVVDLLLQRPPFI
jgi:hypothetical protein